MNKVHKINGFVYVTSEEKPIENQYGIGFAVGIRGVGAKHYLFFHDGSSRSKINAICKYASTVILTDDQDLIKDGIQPISDEFLEWICNNPSCEEVETERLEDGQYFDRLADNSVIEGIYENYKIIIPKEKTKPILGVDFEISIDDDGMSIEIPIVKQETIEEIAKRLTYHDTLDWENTLAMESFKLGYNHAVKTLYTDEEVIYLLQKYRLDLSNKETPTLGNTTKEWFDKNNNKELFLKRFT